LVERGEGEKIEGIEEVENAGRVDTGGGGLPYISLAMDGTSQKKQGLKVQKRTR